MYGQCRDNAGTMYGQCIDNVWTMETRQQEGKWIGVGFIIVTVLARGCPTSVRQLRHSYHVNVIKCCLQMSWLSILLCFNCCTLVGPPLSTCIVFIGVGSVCPYINPWLWILWTPQVYFYLIHILLRFAPILWKVYRDQSILYIPLTTSKVFRAEEGMPPSVF